ncbi:MAG TPA: tRNA pseudouridine(55) synthase TruB [Bauldia sp.]|nr:tRNA pseudouridine(55) synthase TruB [Bauldia sp.]
MSNRRKKGREVNGWLAIDKAVGRTSTEIVASVKRLFGAQKVGHAGTLDPLASGMLPIALGEATKTVPFVQDSRKVYRFTVEWGVETDTDDAEGKPVATADIRPSREAILAALPAFTGEIMQRPPAYSAVKIGGERAYDLAREGETVEIAERPVTVHRLDLADMPDAGHAVFEAECGKGTYVRAIARDLGRALGCLGHVVALRRVSVGPFVEEGAIDLETLIAAREDGGADTLDRFLLPIDTALGELPEIAFHQGDAARIGRGQAVILRGRDAPAFAGTLRATFAGRTIAIGEIDKGAFHPKRVFTG